MGQFNQPSFDVSITFLSGKYKNISELLPKEKRSQHLLFSQRKSYHFYENFKLINIINSFFFFFFTAIQFESVIMMNRVRDIEVQNQNRLLENWLVFKEK